MKFHTKYSPPPSPVTEFNLPSLTQQCFKNECDVNEILKKFRETGSLVDPLHPPTRRPMFGDFTDLPDYQACLEALNDADAAFMALPAAVRDRFNNDPQKVIDFLNEESNFDEAVKLGLCNPRPVVKTDDKSTVEPAN